MKARRLTAALATVLVAGPTAVVAPATADPSRTDALALADAAAVDEPPRSVRWLALGDSYSSGEGVDENYGHCARSPAAYAAEAFEQLRLEGYPVGEQEFLACSGAQIPDVTKSVDLVEQIDQTSGRYDLITLTIGGNDSGFGDLVKDCVIGYCSELADLDLDDFERAYKRRIDAVQPSLIDVYGRLVDELLAPGGNIVVLGYPRLFEASSRWPWYVLGGCEMLTHAEADMVRRLADHANGMIAEAVDQYAGVVHFLDVSPTFEGHNLCAGWRTTNEWINGLSVGGGDSNRVFRYEHSFHPNREGHAAEARVLADFVKGLDWPARPAATVTLRSGGLTVETTGRETVADFGRPTGTDIVAAISTALGEPLYDVGSAEYGMCQGTVERFVAWEPEDEASAALVVALVGHGAGTRLLGYRSYASSPAIEMADGVSIGDAVISLHLAYLLSAADVVLLAGQLDNGAVAFELRGATPRGPELGTLTGPNPDATVVDRGSGEQCGLGSLLTS